MHVNRKKVGKQPKRSKAKRKYKKKEKGKEWIKWNREKQKENSKSEWKISMLNIAVYLSYYI